MICRLRHSVDRLIRQLHPQDTRQPRCVEGREDKKVAIAVEWADDAKQGSLR